MNRDLRLFGSSTRTRLLVALGLLEESYVYELARTLKAERVSLARMVDELVFEGVFVVRSIGRARTISFNPSFPGAVHLKALLNALAQRDPELLEAATRLRRRPRRKHKPVRASEA